jgi:hypothetical protein
VAIFCQTKLIFAGRSLATVKKICEVWRKMGLFWPDSVPPNQLQKKALAELLRPAKSRAQSRFAFFLAQGDNVRAQHDTLFWYFGKEEVVFVGNVE